MTYSSKNLSRRWASRTKQPVLHESICHNMFLQNLPTPQTFQIYTPLQKTFTIIHKHVQTRTQMPARFSHATLKLMAGSFKGIIRCSEWAIMRIRLIRSRQVICLSDRYKHPLQTNQHFNIKPMFHCITKPSGCTQDYSINERKSQNLRVKWVSFNWGAENITVNTFRGNEVPKIIWIKNGSFWERLKESSPQTGETYRH